MPNKRKASKKASPYLCAAVVLILIAVILLAVILVLAFSDSPEPPPVEESSDVPTIHETSEPSEEPSRDESSEPEFSEPSDNGVDESEQSTPGGEDPGLSPTAAYEQRVGKAYAIDMTDWEQYVCPADPMEYVFLVDATHTLAANFEPEDLVWIKDMRKDRPEYYSKLRFCAEKALEAFLEEGRQYGIDDVKVSNGFRSYSIQKSLFESYKNDERAKHPDYTEEQIEALVLTYSLRPGTSEHQSGLCVDMHNQINTDLSFAGTKAAIWLEENCYRFGFILRYPEDKEDITTVMFEPWHFRFVGREAATEMHDLGMCLEEYCAYKGIA
ncbi:MAG: M15 family metallopeptidase [Oscillospiraceae bacterium]|nr:M15 family metallopeptidase [Oscillospiraceae bacterium]